MITLDDNQGRIKGGAWAHGPPPELIEGGGRPPPEEIHLVVCLFVGVSVRWVCVFAISKVIVYTLAPLSQITEFTNDHLFFFY